VRPSVTELGVRTWPAAADRGGFIAQASEQGKQRRRRDLGATDRFGGRIGENSD